MGPKKPLEPFGLRQYVNRRANIRVVEGVCQVDCFFARPATQNVLVVGVFEAEREVRSRRAGPSEQIQPSIPSRPDEAREAIRLRKTRHGQAS